MVPLQKELRFADKLSKLEGKFDKRSSPSGKEYYWLTGEFELLDKGEDTDVHALNNGYVSVVPTQFDFNCSSCYSTYK